jgi:hypothetical protein
LGFKKQIDENTFICMVLSVLFSSVYTIFQQPFLSIIPYRQKWQRGNEGADGERMITLNAKTQ